MMKYLKWIPVSARCPDEELCEYRAKYGADASIELIVYIRGADVPTMLAYDGTGFFIPEDAWDDDHEYYTVTHWMSMPPRPDMCIIDIDLGDQIEANFEMLETILT